jgi:hypothetical protein
MIIIVVYAFIRAEKLLFRIDNENYFIFIDILLISVIFIKIFLHSRLRLGNKKVEIIQSE